MNSSAKPMLRGTDLKQAYARGENISALLRTQSGGGGNSELIIETAYDLQAGSYVASHQSETQRDYKCRYSAEIVRVLLRLGRPASVLEAGVGEATTLSYVLRGLATPEIPAVGVDLCWSRLRWARQWLGEQGVSHAKLAMATLKQLPFTDGAFDIVYTSHSIEPNGGSEPEILAELYRVTGRWLVLLEPGYELAGPEARARMESHGYCRDLVGHAHRLGMKVIEHSLFPVMASTENPTALTIIAKSPPHTGTVSLWACPVCHTPLLNEYDFWFCESCFLAFPVLDGLPCLRREKGIIASQLLDH